jgi:hypothetical protein
MSYKIKRLASGLNVSNIVWALQENPGLWDEHTSRTRSPESPHHDMSDIWLRYAPDTEFRGEHDSVWLPPSDILPVKDMVYDLMRFCDGERLGGIWLTRLPAFKECKPHIDEGWHAGYYRKFAIQIKSSPGQLFIVEDESLESRPGDVYEFINNVTHSVTNPTEFERITMIVCIKTGRVF